MLLSALHINAELVAKSIKSASLHNTSYFIAFDKADCHDLCHDIIFLNFILLCSIGIIQICELPLVIYYTMLLTVSRRFGFRKNSRLSEPALKTSII